MMISTPHIQTAAKNNNLYYKNKNNDFNTLLVPQTEPAITAFLLIDSNQKTNWSDFLFVQFLKAEANHKKKADPGDYSIFKIVDVANDPHFYVEMDVYDLPTLKVLLPNGRIVNLAVRKNGFTDAQIVELVIDQYYKFFLVNPTYELYKSKSRAFVCPFAMQEYIKKAKMIAVYIGNNQQEFELFSELAERYDKVEFIHCLRGPCFKYFKTTNCSVFLYNNTILIKSNWSLETDRLKETNFHRKILKSGFDKLLLYQLIHSMYSPALNELSEFTLKLVFADKKPAVLFLLEEKNPELFVIAKEAAEKLKDKILLLISYNNNSFFDKQLHIRMKKVDEEFPEVWIADTRKHLRRFKMNKSFTVENIVEFYEDWDSGVLMPETVTAPEKLLFDHDRETKTKTIVASNFNKLVYDDPDDVVVYYYSSWDDISSYIVMNMFVHVAEKDFSKTEGIKFYKIDVLYNELELIETNPYKDIPALQIFGKKQGKYNPVDFLEQGNYEFGYLAFYNFIKDNTLTE